jgi:hypothetical protein
MRCQVRGESRLRTYDVRNSDDRRYPAKVKNRSGYFLQFLYADLAKKTAAMPRLGYSRFYSYLLNVL